MEQRQSRLLDFVKLQHGNQLRKYDNTPYWWHLLNVAKKADKHVKLGFEVGLCHDLFEDTECRYLSLFMFLISNNYSIKESFQIVYSAYQLTDRYTKERYPKLNRKARKALECKRLGKTSYLAQTVKYSDLIDNSRSIVARDKNFAVVYIKEKRNILDKMRKGNIDLLIECCEVIAKSQREINIHK